MHRLGVDRVGANLLSQIIYTTHLTDDISTEDYLEIGIKNDKICKSLGLTGRLFVVENEHLNIIEGPSSLNEKYFRAFVSDPRVGSTLRHYSTDIETREFSDYSVWVNHTALSASFLGKINHLTRESLNTALPVGLSMKARMMVDGYVRIKL
jgi:hypothetical protein